MNSLIGAESTCPLPQAARTCLTSKVPRCSRVTALARRKIVTAKCAFTVMTCHATLAATGCVMIQRFGCGDLPTLRHSRSYLMTFIAIYLLMLCMAKADAECLRKCRSPRIAAQRMTGTA